jgi:hypothetical protein
MRVRTGALPPSSEPVADLIARLKKNSARSEARRKAETWLPIYFPEFKPFAVVWFGDPHLDDPHCEWSALERDIAIASKPGIYGACIGDLRNNWVGRLVRLYMDQHATHGDGHRLAEWFLRDCGVNWALNILGNHDLWNEGEVIAGLVADKAMYVAAWEARVEFRSANNKAAWRVHASHDFKGSSVYNKTHGALKQMMFSGAEAELYVCGHKHTFGYQAVEHDYTGRVSHIVRARGYKGHDMHAVTNGYPQGRMAQSVMTIFDPSETSPAKRVLTFFDTQAGEDYLAFLRRDRTPAKKKQEAKPPAKRSKIANPKRGKR